VSFQNLCSEIKYSDINLQEFSKSLRIYTFNGLITTMWPKQETAVSGELVFERGSEEKAFPVPEL
jgi:hypothetical protein